MQVTPYLQFEGGKCRDALAFYAEVLGGSTVFAMNFGEAPEGPPVEAEWQDKVMHAQFEAPGIVLFACDSPPQYQQRPQGFALTLSVDEPEEAERIFAALAKGGTVTMAIAETFWAQRFGMLTDRFGMLTDRFGMPWMVSCDKPMEQAA